MSAAKALQLYGKPGGAQEAKYMLIWAVPPDVQAAFKHVRFSALGTLGFPTRIYCHRLLQPLLEVGLRNLMAKGLAHELKTWDGCYVVRNARGLNQWSMHAWGLAFDINAATNRLGNKPSLSPAFVECFAGVGLTWGGTWKRADGMHFEVNIK